MSGATAHLCSDDPEMPIGNLEHAGEPLPSTRRLYNSTKTGSVFQTPAGSVIEMLKECCAREVVGGSLLKSFHTLVHCSPDRPDLDGKFVKLTVDEDGVVASFEELNLDEQPQLTRELLLLRQVSLDEAS